MKIKLKNISKGWFSLATHSGTSIEMKVNGIAIIDVPKEYLNYYNQFIPLGIALEVLKEIPVEVLQEEIPVEKVQLENNHIDEVIDKDVKDEGINKIVPDLEVPTEDQLEKLTKVQLRELCTSLNIVWNKQHLKKDLIHLIIAECESDL